MSASVVITDGDDLIEVAPQAATLMRWQVRENDLIDGCRGEAEIDSVAGSRSALLIPWVSHMRNARYRWNGEEYDLDPRGERLGTYMHGFWREIEATVKDQGENWVTFAGLIGARGGYPWPLQVAVTYRLDGVKHCLDLEVEVTNKGGSAAPVGIGWHPYFWRDDKFEVTMRAGAKVILGADMTPLDGDKAYEELDGQGTVRLTDPRNLDCGWSDLEVGDNGQSEVQISTSRGEIVMTMDSTFSSVCHVYTGEGLGERPGQAVAVEPWSVCGNAFNRSDLAGELMVDAGKKRVWKVRLNWLGKS